MSDRDWFVPLGPSIADASGQVFALPHAGAGCAQLAALAKRTGPAVAVWAANLPGRQARRDEPPVGNLRWLVDTLATHVAKAARPRFALFGYCGGGLLALLVARALRDRGGREPAALIVAASEAPDVARPPAGVAGLPSRLLWERLAASGGVPARLAEDARLRLVAEPAVRADFAMLASYRYEPAPPLACPVTVCFGQSDPTPRGAWLGWRRQTTGPLRLRPLPGGHWLLDEAGEQLATVLAESAP